MLVTADLGHCLSLRKVLPHGEFLGADDIAVSACSCDWQRVRPGCLFVALPTSADDPHCRIAEAIARGCSGVVAEHEAAVGGVPVCYVPDAREAYGRICQALAGNPSQRLKVIGVTGRGGTTTTACLIASILSAARVKVGVIGQLGCLDGREVTHHGHGPPTAPDLAQYLGRMLHNGCTHAVMEVPSRALEQGGVAGINFDAACVTSGHSGLAESRRPTRPHRLVGSGLLRSLGAEALAVINADDPAAMEYLGLIDGPVLTVGMTAEAEITARFLERYPSEQTILLWAGSEAMPVRTRMIGRDHAYHCLTAAAIGLAYGVDLPTVVRGLEAVDYVPGRLERIECGQPFGVFVDQARTPQALTACLKTLREVIAGRILCVFGAGGNGDRAKRARAARAIEAHADLIVLTDGHPHAEDPQAILEDLLAGLEHPAEAEVIPDRAEAIGWAIGRARPGDGVLIAGQRRRTHPTVGNGPDDFDDRQVARQCLCRLR